jgi:Mpv17 / PMP22 family
MVSSWGLIVSLSLAGLHAVLFSQQQSHFAATAFHVRPIPSIKHSVPPANENVKGYFKSTHPSYRTASPSAATTAASTKSTTTTALHSSLAVTAAFSALDSFWQSSPYTAAALICGVKASAADMVAQKRDLRKREEKERKAAVAAAAAAESLQASAATSTAAAAAIYNPDLSSVSSITQQVQKKKADWKRNVAFVVYGSLYQGVTQEYVYNHLYPVWFGSATSIPVVATKVLFDLLIQTTLVTLPIAYLTKSIIYRYSFTEAIRRYVDDIKNHGLLKKYYLLWGPVQCVTFGIIPEHYRVTFIAFVSFFWLIILSTIASKTPAAPASADQADAAECLLEDGLTCNIDG